MQAIIVSARRYLIMPVYLLVGTSMATILLAIPLNALEMGASEVMLGGYVSAYASTGLVFSFVGAGLCHRFGERWLLVWAFGCYVLAHLVGALAPSPGWLMLAAVTAGVGDLLFTIGGMTFLTQVGAVRNRDMIISTAFSFLRVGSVIGSVVAGYAAGAFGFGVVFMLGASLSGAGMLLAAGLAGGAGTPADRPAAVPGLVASYKAARGLLRANRTARLVGILTALSTMGWFTFRSSFYLQYLRGVELSTEQIGLLMGLGSAAMVVAPFGYAALARRTGALVAIVLGMAGAGLGLALVPFFASMVALGVVGVLAQVADSFRMPGVFSMVSQGTGPAERPTAVAVINTAWAVTALCAGPLWGLVARSGGLAAAFYLAGAVTLGAGLVVYGATRRRAPTHRPEVDTLEGRV